MISLLTNYFTKQYLPRWIILIFDLFVVWFSFLLAYILRFNFDYNQAEKIIDYKLLLAILPIYGLCFYLIKSYSGILRHSSTQDISRIIFPLSIASIIIALFSYSVRYFELSAISVIPYSVILIQFSLSSITIVISRLLIKAVYFQWFLNQKDVKRLMIFGAGRLGQITRNALTVDDSLNIKIIGFIDDNLSLQNKTIAGVRIYSSKVAFEKIAERNKIDEIILAIEKKKLPIKRKREIVDLCLAKKIKIKEVPIVSKWLDGKLTSGNIRNIKIDDLLGRDSISLNTENIKNGLKESVILITGAAGSIGSEIVRQLLIFNAKRVVLLDKAESDLYDLQNEIIAKYKTEVKLDVIVGDVCNKTNLRKVFDKYKPTIVLNAAAYKHVPLMEQYPNEAIRVNIGGTRNLADLSLEFGVKKFVMVSTDKAVNPTNVMGASKRISEIYIQSLSQRNTGVTQFITTRFGNVLGSNGSVVPLFKKQIENGGPITVTHSEVTRFFMTIPEACQLVLEACFMGNGGEIFVFDMGEPVKIYKLAEKMILLSGLVPNKDINIEIVGLRPGEKLYEELLNSAENTLPTHNDKIMIGKTRKHDYEVVNEQLNVLLNAVDEWESQALVDHMRTIVPEFISQNSHFKNAPVTEKAIS